MQSKSVLILLAMTQAFMALGDCSDGGDNCPAVTVDVAQSSALIQKQDTRASSHATEEESDKDYCDRNACSSGWVHKSSGCAAKGKGVACWNSDDNYQCCEDRTYCARNSCANWVHKSSGCKGEGVACWNSDDNYQCCEDRKYCAGNSCANWVHKSSGCNGKGVACWNSDDNYQCCESSALLAKQATRASSHATEEESDQDTSDGKKKCKTHLCQTALEECITHEEAQADPRARLNAAATCLEAGQAEPWPGALKQKQPHYIVVAKCSLCVVASNGDMLTAQTCDEARAACMSGGTNIMTCMGLQPAQCQR